MHQYDNPVISGFHPDPSVCRVGDDYYLVCSSFEYFPGLPLFHSKDLVHWEQIGNVLDRPGQLPLPLPGAKASGGLYAPTIRHHDGRYWVINTNVDGGGNFIVSAERPEGPWSDPVWIDLSGIDPDLAWEEDGTCWCAFSGPRGGVNMARIDPVQGKVLEGPFPTWSGSGLKYPEAPHLYRIGAWWYLLIAEGGTERGHSVSMARSRSPRGPWEAAPANPLLSHSGTARTIQNTGHADLVEAVDGSWWMVLLGVRPRGFTPDVHVLGRETFLTPVEWGPDGWPVVAPVPERHAAPGGAWHPVAAPPARDDFDGPVLAPHWISPFARPEDSWSLTERPGSLVLRATGPTLDRPGYTFVGRRQQHHDCRVTALIDPGTGRGGLCVRLDEAHHYEVETGAGEAGVVARIGPLRQTVARLPVPPGPLRLTVTCRTSGLVPASPELTDGGTTGPDTLAFWLGDPDAPDSRPLAELDGRYLSTEVACGFTGRVIGMYATEGTVAFDWFEYVPASTPPA
ncbi:glycoside hydrolase family 43 protein [Streptomyces rochei]|uniref:glycoside hydrolase family 43 protein n=1 Tax=Streptomyces TaxID=1883 RepID=UPI000D51A80E|nr:MULTISPECIES: glycoside hydrolase family 43 protein [unclassified Streptomyces]PVD07488.1 glycoside hydrolase 43 family protein [Streptomyces sp. CS207]RSS02103.1 glycoside hydrolase family 43 protein [Streptomyces sp. WAC04189]RSS28218.1 glycoside hydrolase family 43 protein [Streptomyces sp. WAC08452]RSS67129.1 glycoside hydrolase family 43 protein [Streptomyces sp. WAC06273]